MANSVERYYQKKKKRKKRAKVVFFSLLFVFMMITLAILSMTVFFNAEKIEVEGNTHYSIEELLETGGLRIGQNLFRLDKFEVIEKMESLPYVKTVTIKRKLPNTLTVKVVENQPVVWVEAKGGVALLNEEYRVLELLELPAEMLPDRPSAAIDLEKEAEQEAAAEALKEEAAEPADEPEEEDAPEAEPEDEEGEEAPVYSQLEEIPRLVGVQPTELTVGKTALFGELDYTGFLLRLYESFSRDPALQWILVDEVQFMARYDIKVIYEDRIVIDFGTLDRAETKVELASYLLQENSTAQAATLDVSDVERVYYRPRS